MLNENAEYFFFSFMAGFDDAKNIHSTCILPQSSKLLSF